jgi:hypothetical protein
MAEKIQESFRKGDTRASKAKKKLNSLEGSANVVNSSLGTDVSKSLLDGV